MAFGVEGAPFLIRVWETGLTLSFFRDWYPEPIPKSGAVCWGGGSRNLLGDIGTVWRDDTPLRRAGQGPGRRRLC